MSTGPARDAGGSARRSGAASSVTLLALLGLIVLSVAALVPVSIWGGVSTSSAWGSMAILGLPFALVGVAVARYQPANAIGWIFLAFVALVVITNDASLYNLLVYRLGDRELPLGAVSVFLQLSWAPAIALLPLPILLFPDGRLPSRRWRWALGAYLAAAGLWVVGLIMIAVGAVVTDTIHVTSGGDLTVVDRPTGGMAWFASAEVVILAVLVGCWLVWTGWQIVSWRRASGERRQQLTWLAAGAAVTAICIGFTVVLGTVAPQGGSSGVPHFVSIVVYLGIAALPLSIGVGILKYRLYEIDVIIRKTLIYATLVASLAVVYLGGVYLIGRALQTLTGQSGALAVTLSTLAVAAAFQPLRRRIQRVVDRRFYRAKYDAARALDAFSERLRDQIDLTTLRVEVLDVAHATLQPRHASLWLRPSEHATYRQTGARPFASASQPAPRLDQTGD